MSNKKAKQARKARQASANSEAKKTKTWQSKLWTDYTDAEKQQLLAAGIYDVHDFIRVKTQGVESAHTDDLFWWLTNYGVGLFRSETELIHTLAKRLFRIEKDLHWRQNMSSLSSGDDSRMDELYVWNLKNGFQYCASPYSFYTPEGRTWLMSALRKFGISHLGVDTGIDGDFDVNDVVLLDLNQAA